MIRSKKAFSLAEICLVLLISGVCFMLFINAFNALQDENKFKAKKNTNEQVADKQNYEKRIQGAVNTLDIKISDENGNFISPFGDYAGEKMKIAIYQTSFFVCETGLYEQRLLRQEIDTSATDKEFIYNFSVLDAADNYLLNKTISSEDEDSAKNQMAKAIESFRRYFPEAPDLFLDANGNLKDVAAIVPSKPLTSGMFNLAKDCVDDRCTSLAASSSDGTELENASVLLAPGTKVKTRCQESKEKKLLDTVEIEIPSAADVKANHIISIKIYNPNWRQKMIERKQEAGIGLNKDEILFETNR